MVIRYVLSVQMGGMGNECPARRVGHSLPVGNTVNRLRLLTGKLRRNRGFAYPFHPTLNTYVTRGLPTISARFLDCLNQSLAVGRVVGDSGTAFIPFRPAMDSRRLRRRFAGGG